MRRRGSIGLSERDRAVIDLEREWGQSPHLQAQKWEAARRDLGLTPAGYSLIVRGLLGDPQALAYDPETITRLRGVREVSHAHREDPHPLADVTSHRLASDPRSFR